MKKLFAVLILPFISAMVFSVQADPRIEEECHFVYDAADADNEIKDQNCGGGTIHTHDVDGVEVASGYAELEQRYSLNDGVMVGVENVELKGDGVVWDLFDTSLTQQNSDCVMVTRNWNNANQAYNYTEYRTRDWNSTVKLSGYRMEDQSIVYTFKTACRNGLAQ